MISERPWLLPCSNINKLHKLYKSYTIAYQDLINNTIESWNNQSNINYEKKLEKYILVGNQNDQFWHLTINLDWYFYNYYEKTQPCKHIFVCY